MRDLSTMAVLALSVSLAGPAFSQQAGGTAIFALNADLSTLNRNVSNQTPDGLVACNIYEGLVDVTPAGEIVPRLAESWTISDDGMTYNFVLRAAKFHDGTPVTSADVKYTYEEISGKVSSLFSAVKGTLKAIETPSDKEVVLKLNAPYGPLLRSLNCTQGASILPKHLYEGTDPMTNPVTMESPVGTGPFKFVSWQRGEYIKLAKNPDYWAEGLPYLDELIAQVLPQASSRTQALLAGQVDYVNFSALPSNDYVQFAGNDAFTMIPSPVPAIEILQVNTRKPELADPKVRQAMMMAIDRKRLHDTAFNGVGAVGTMPFTNRMAWAVDAETDFDKLYPYDVEKAKALLDEAGLKADAGGKRMSLRMTYISTEADGHLVGTALKAMFGEVGIDLVLEPAEEVALNPAVFSNFDFDLSFLAYNSGGDPAIGLSRIWTSETAGRNFGNPTGYSNPEIDALFQQARNESDLTARGAIYAKIQHILGRDLPVLTLHERINQSGLTSRLKGLENEYYLPSFRSAHFVD